MSPLTGYYRDGYCNTGEGDYGTHTVCAKTTDDFLLYSKSRGNDLMRASSSFPGLKDGDRWCLCADRWLEAYHANKAPRIIGRATNRKTLKYIDRELLDKYNMYY